METLTIATPDGADLKVWVEGAGPPLMLVTGLGGNGRFWAPASARLAERRKVITFDHRGVAGSTRGSAPLDIALLARDCLTILDALALPRVALLGHSMGGAIGQTLCSLAPERLTALVLSATWLAPDRFLQELFAARRVLLAADGRAYAALAALMGYPPAWLRAHGAVLDAALAAAPVTPERQALVAERIDALLAFDGRPHLGRYGGPVLVQGAADDMIVPAYLQDALAAAMPDAARHVFPSGGHLFPVSETDAFVQTLSAWLDGLAP
jgi:pimeloyl-ACP methyl ester carboxylesterase